MTSPIIRNLKVAGTFFRTAPEKAALMALIGHAEPVAVAFQPEPTNPHDPHAVAVRVLTADGNWTHAGYIPATVSALFATWLATEPGGLTAACDVGVAKGCPEVTLTVSIEAGGDHG